MQNLLRFSLVCGALFLPGEAAAVTRLLFLGDSLTEGYGIVPEEAFPALVQQALVKEGYAVESINAGVSGSTTASGPSRLRWHLKAQPHVLILALGANDGLRGLPLTAIRKNLMATLKLARDQRLKILIVGMKMPPNYGPAYAEGFEAIFPALAKHYEVPLVPFLLDRIAGERDLNLADGLHPNAKGHRVMAGIVAEALKPLLKKDAP